MTRSPWFNPSSTCVRVPLLMPTLIGTRRRPGPLVRVEHVDRRLARGVVGNRGLGNDQHVRPLLEHDLRVRRHVRLELVAGIVDRDAHLEVRDVVALDAHRRNLRHLALERAFLERLDADARRLAEPQIADLGLVDTPANEHVRDVAHRDDRRRRRAHVENRRYRAADLDVARENASADWRADRGVRELFLGTLDGRLRLRDVRRRFRHAGFRDGELRLGGAPAILGLVELRARFLELVNGNQLLLEQALRALVRAPRERDLRALGFDAALFELRLRCLQRRPRALQRRARLAHARHQILAVELDEHGARFDLLIDLDRQQLDDAVGFRFDFDLGDRLDFSRRNHRPRDRAALDRGEPRLRNVGRSAKIGGGAPPHHGQGEDRHSAVDGSFPGLRHVYALSDGRAAAKCCNV